MYKYAREKIFSFEKSPRQEVRFELSERNGKPFASINVYFIEEDGSKVRTQREIGVYADKLLDLKQGIDQLVEAAGVKTVKSK